MDNITSEQKEKSFYEVPTLTKYGTMKSIVQGGSGSGGDEMATGGTPPNPRDPTVRIPDIGGANVPDGFFKDGSQDRIFRRLGANTGADNLVTLIDSTGDS